MTKDETELLNKIRDFCRANAGTPSVERTRLVLDLLDRCLEKVVEQEHEIIRLKRRSLEAATILRGWT